MREKKSSQSKKKFNYIFRFIFIVNKDLLQRHLERTLLRGVEIAISH